MSLALSQARDGHSGIAYVATDREEFVELALISLASLRTIGGLNEPAVIFTNLPRTTLWRDQSTLNYRPIRVENQVDAYSRHFSSRQHRLLVPQRSPFEQTLLLDCDTIARRPCHALWTFLRDHDLAMCRAPNETLAHLKSNPPNWGDARDWQATFDECPADTPHYNAGVILFRTHAETVRRFFATWHTQWLRYRASDQCAMIRTIASMSSPIRDIPQRFNAVTRKQQQDTDAAIVHLSGIRNYAALAAHMRELAADPEKPPLWRDELRTRPAARRRHRPA